MKTSAKIIVVLLLVVAVIAVLVLKSADSEKSVVTQAEYSFVEGLPMLMDFGGGKCTPCKMMVPVLEELGANYSDGLNVTYVDYFEEKELVQKYSVQIIPTQLFLDANGVELFRHEGFYSKDEILAKWNELGYEIASEN